MDLHPLLAIEAWHGAWGIEDDILQITRCETGAMTISISVQRHEETSDADRRLSIYLYTLQHISSQNANLPLTLETTRRSTKQQRLVTDVGCQNRCMHIFRGSLR